MELVIFQPWKLDPWEYERSVTRENLLKPRANFTLSITLDGSSLFPPIHHGVLVDSFSNCVIALPVKMESVATTNDATVSVPTQAQLALALAIIKFKPANIDLKGQSLHCVVLFAMAITDCFG